MSSFLPNRSSSLKKIYAGLGALAALPAMAAQELAGNFSSTGLNMTNSTDTGMSHNEDPIRLAGVLLGVLGVSAALGVATWLVTKVYHHCPLGRAATAERAPATTETAAAATTAERRTAGSMTELALSPSTRANQSHNGSEETRHLAPTSAPGATSYTAMNEDDEVESSLRPGSSN